MNHNGILRIGVAVVGLLTVFSLGFCACSSSSSTGQAGVDESSEEGGGIPGGFGEGEAPGFDLGGNKLVVTVLSPPADTTVLADAPLALSVRVHAGELLVANAVVTWVEESSEGIVAEGITGADGVCSLPVDGLSPGLHVLIVEGVVPSGQSATASVEIRAVLSPSAPLVTILPESPGAADTLFSMIVEPSSVNGNDEITYAYGWRVNGELLPNAVGETLSPAAAFRGDLVALEVTPLVFGYSGPSGVATTVIVNTSPSAKGAQIEPTEGFGLTPFQCVAQGWGDVDGDVPVDLFRWERNGIIVDGANGDILPPGTTSRDDVIRCELTPHDGIDGGVPKWSAALTVSNGPPSVAAAKVTPDPGSVSAVFTCHAEGASDPDGDEVLLVVSWMANNEEILGLDGTLPGAVVAKGDFIACMVQPDDGELVGATVLSPAVQVGNAPPLAMTPTVIPSSATVVDILTCDVPPAIDPDGDGTDYLYTWSVNGVPVGGDKTLASPAFHRGDSVVCIVTPTDGWTTGPSASSLPIMIQNAPPQGGAVEVLPSNPTVLSSLNCAAGGADDPDGDPVFWSFAWKVNDVLANGEESSLNAPAFSKGDKVVCIATPSDGEIAGSAVESGMVIIGNAPPSVGQVAILPLLPTSASELTCDVLNSTDPDGDSLVFFVSWNVNGEIVAAGEDLTLKAPAFVGGDMVFCTVVASDGVGQSEGVNSEPVVIGNTPPSLEAAVITPPIPTVLDTLACDPIGWVDTDGDAPLYTYSWDLNGVPMPFEVGSTLNVPSGSKGSSITCTVTPHDGFDTGYPVTSAPVVIVNALPTVGKAQIFPDAGNQSTLFTCIASVVVDPDGDEATLSYKWYVNESPVSGATEKVVQNVQFPETAFLYCEVTPYDGEGVGPSLLSDPSTLVNVPPAIDSVSLEPTEPTTVDDLECTPGGWFDADDDAPQYFYSWLVDGLIVMGEDESGLSHDLTIRGQQWRCEVFPYDGLDVGTPLLSDSVLIANTAPVVDSVWLTPEVAYINTTLNCIADGWFDPDEDLPQFLYSWTINAEIAVALTGNTFVATEANIGDVVSCEVTPFDAFDTGIPVVASNEVEIVNAVPEVEILAPEALEYGTGDVVVFSAQVSDLEDAPTELQISWQSDLDGLLYEGIPDENGFDGFTWLGMSPGQHIITVSAVDTMGGVGTAEVILVVGFVCGATTEPATSLEPTWSSGFEDGSLFDWDFANYRFVVSGHLIPANCDFDEYIIHPDSAQSGQFGLGLMPNKDAFLLLKLFGEEVDAASVEGWVRVVGGLGLKIGFVSQVWENDPEGFETTGFLNVISSTKAVAYDGNAPNVSLNLPADTWSLIRLVRDVEEGTMTIYVNNIYQSTLSGISPKPLLGFAVGMTDVFGVSPDGHLDDFSYVIE